MKNNYTAKEIVGMIRELETGKEYKMTITCNSGYGVNNECNSLYQKCRYHIKKLNSGVRVTREYNQIILVK